MISKKIRQYIQKFMFLAFIMTCISSTAYAANYYVDASVGNDSNPGTQSAPWRTVAKVNAKAFSPGDNIYFQSGQTWREQLNPSSAGTDGNLITYGAYGSGEKPIINGSNIVTGWSQYSGNIYRAT